MPIRSFGGPDARVCAVPCGGMTRQELRAALAAKGVRLNEYAERLLASERLATSPVESIVRVVVLPVRRLCAPHPATLDGIVAAARDFGLLPCPLELAPRLRLLMLDQTEEASTVRNAAPKGSVTVISEIPDPEDEDFPKGFYLRVIGGEPWLRGYVCPLDHAWDGDDVVALRRPDGLSPPPCPGS